MQKSTLSALGKSLLPCLLTEVGALLLERSTAGQPWGELHAPSLPLLPALETECEPESTTDLGPTGQDPIFIGPKARVSPGAAAPGILPDSNSTLIQRQAQGFGPYKPSLLPGPC